MIISLIGIVLGILITALWIFIPLKKIPQEKKIPKGVYIRSVLLGVTLCSLCICILEITWDRVTGINASAETTLWEAFATSFLRAALIEELIKLLFVKRVLKKHKPSDKLQYMLLAGTIGMGYAITEKLMLPPGALLLNAFFAFHVMFQFLMGIYLYKAETAESASEKRRMSIMAFLVPFAIHGTWDTAMFVSEKALASVSEILQLIGVIAFIVLIVAGIVFEVKMILYLKKLVAEEKQAVEI